jgi:hypothetical protein
MYLREHLDTTDGKTLCLRKATIQLIEHRDTADGITVCQWNISMQVI